MLACWLMLASAALGQTAGAEEDGWRAPPATRLLLQNVLAIRYNPIGLEDQLKVLLQQRLYEHPSALLRDNWISIGLSPKMNPAYIRLGAMAEVQPASIFNLRITGERVWYLRSFNYLQSFESPRANFSDSQLRSRAAESLSYATTAWHATLEPTFQVKVKAIAIRNRTTLELWKADLSQGDLTFYEGTLDTLIPNGGWVISNDLDVLYTGPRRVFGVRYSAVVPFYDHADDNSHHRLGPLFAYTFFDHRFARFDRPTVFAVAQWYVKHRFRTGADVSGLIPYLAVGFSFQADLFQPPEG
jgi:hypothetical protein